LYNNITNTIDGLLDEYKFWTKSDVCNNLEFIYYDKLIRLKNSDLINASTAIGYRFNSNVNKQKVCETIINHYKKQVNLLKHILNTIRKVQNKIDHANNGPICKNVDGFIDDLYNCKRINGAEWISKKEYSEYITTLKKHKKYTTWKLWLDNLSNIYNSSLIDIQNIINKIKGNINKTLSEGEYNALVIHSKNILERLDQLSDIYYILTINNC